MGKLRKDKPSSASSSRIILEDEEIFDPEASDSEQMEEDEYVVERILASDYRTAEGKMYYKVLWKGYPRDQATWEPEENVKCVQLIQEFKNRKKRFNADEDDDDFIVENGEDEEEEVGEEEEDDERTSWKRSSQIGSSSKSRKRKEKSRIESPSTSTRVRKAMKLEDEVKRRRRKKGREEGQRDKQRDQALEEYRRQRREKMERAEAHSRSATPAATLTSFQAVRKEDEEEDEEEEVENEKIDPNMAEKEETISPLGLSVPDLATLLGEEARQLEEATEHREDTQRKEEEEMQRKDEEEDQEEEELRLLIQKSIDSQPDSPIGDVQPPPLADLQIGELSDQQQEEQDEEKEEKDDNEENGDDREAESDVREAEKSPKSYAKQPSPQRQEREPTSEQQQQATDEQKRERRRKRKEKQRQQQQVAMASADAEEAEAAGNRQLRKRPAARMDSGERSEEESSGEVERQQQRNGRCRDAGEEEEQILVKKGPTKRGRKPAAAGGTKKGVKGTTRSGISKELWREYLGTDPDAEVEMEKEDKPDYEPMMPFEPGQLARCKVKELADGEENGLGRGLEVESVLGVGEEPAKGQSRQCFVKFIGIKYPQQIAVEMVQQEALQAWLQWCGWLSTRENLDKCGEYWAARLRKPLAWMCARSLRAFGQWKEAKGKGPWKWKDGAEKHDQADDEEEDDSNSSVSSSPLPMEEI